MKEQIKIEQGVHGEQWNGMHGGYFSDPAVAAPFLHKIRDLAAKSRPDVIVDLGGGTGFLLSQLLMDGNEHGVSLVNLDGSNVQLDAAKQAGFSCVCKSVDSFSRRDVGSEKGRFLFMMRSVLHYFGKDGLRPVLRHLHTQTKQGEFFVHQTASFSNQKDANCLNVLYQMMRTRKWYPTVDFLCKCLREEGWQVLEVFGAEPLRLTDDDLLKRYHLNQTDIQRIRSRLSQDELASEEVFKKTDEGFQAVLHYWTYICTPAI